MARPIERIERDIAVLEEAIDAIAKELQTAYASYLTSLGKALQKQLILASYHLCTQGYPENFLKLTLSKRQNLQQGIRNLGKQATEQLLALTQNEHEQSQLQQEPEDIKAEETTEADKEEEEEEVEEVEEDSIPNILFLEADSPATLVSKTLVTPNTSNPIELMKWQQYLESSTQNTLKRVSRQANLLLQKAGILPKKLPEPILEAAAAVSEASAEVVPGPPNLLNLVIEIENDKHSEESNLTQIMAINLRLGEIEFADTKLSSERKQIRNIIAQLNKIGLDYQKKQRERSVAEAESAWRASWFDD
ncbi:hypothetical protein ACF3DV_17590 [Chlorogloeopsis fritschii PCC 9212]|uniref:Primosomal protein n=1 Tax=Chlorogloeopsis fritschii PCC 6912 TaxID=211165 RepID=A0A433N0A1_CHLFR|nr:hypothetical protein [Chlorogloeopsis fritschii]RUR74245.1 hypothetical protein PCC6912_53460 [Chlorogloeopsis fritschii PCC 6912]